jgi:hypothetical protein
MFSVTDNLWLETLAALNKRQPCLSRMILATTDHKHHIVVEQPLCNFLKIAIGASHTLQQDDAKSRRLAMIAPRWCEGAGGVAIGTALCAMSEDFCRGIKSQPAFKPGQRLKFDDKAIVEWVREDEDWIWLRDRDGEVRKPREFHLRLHPTTSRRALGVLGFAGRETETELDHILDIHSLGAQHLFRTRVLWLTPSVSRALSHWGSLLIGHSVTTENRDEHFVPLLDAWQWGRLRESGEVLSLSTGQHDASPVIILVSDVVALGHFLREAKHQAQNCMILLDGGAALRRQWNAVDDWAESGAAIFACLDGDEDEARRQLQKRNFTLWRWSQRDAAAICASPQGGAFARLERGLNNFARHQVEEQPCENAALQNAARAFFRWQKQLDETQPLLEELRSQIFFALLHVAHLLYPIESDDEAAARWQQRGAQCEAALADCGLYLAPEYQEVVRHILSTLDEAARDTSSKMNALLDIAARSQSNELLVVVPETECNSTQNYWRGVLASQKQRLQFCAPEDAETFLQRSQVARGDASTSSTNVHLILGGWINASRLRRLLGGSFASLISILQYPFERAWLSNARGRWHGQESGLTYAQKINWLSLENIDAAANDDTPGAEVQSWRVAATIGENQNKEDKDIEEFDILGFELHVRTQRRLQQAGALIESGERTCEAFTVEFSGGHFALLTRYFHLPVVNALLHESLGESTPQATPTTRFGFNQKSELPEKTVRELTVGDYVIFRCGAHGNIIRELADGALKKSGLFAMRETSRLWKVVLRRWIENEKNTHSGQAASTQRAIQKLRKLGIRRDVQTIRGWIEPDRTIKPRDDNDIVLIAQITGDEELSRRYNEVLRACEQVYRAHHKAGEFLSAQLRRRLPAVLQNACWSPDNPIDYEEFEIENIGSIALARVTDVNTEPLQVHISKVNTLMKD